MISRRHFLSTASSLTATLLVSYTQAQLTRPYRSSLPIILGKTAMPTATPSPMPTATLSPTPSPTPVPPGDDMPILGPASGSYEEAHAWLTSHGTPYTAYDVGVIVAAYRSIGEQVGMDWFMALAQMAHETGSLTSFWSQRPQRNPAGIGVDGSAVEGSPDDPPPEATGWAYNTQRNRWEKGLSFPSWANDSVPAHLGRLLAYALRDEWANDAQYQLIQQALSWRGLPADKRGVSQTYVGLNGKWAVPGTSYGQTIIAMAKKMRGLA